MGENPSEVAVQVYFPAFSGTTDEMVISPPAVMTTLLSSTTSSNVTVTVGLGFPSARQSNAPVTSGYDAQTMYPDAGLEQLKKSAGFSLN